MTNLGTLKEITDLRSIWPHEACSQVLPLQWHPAHAGAPVLVFPLI